jgi:hypothetical protein
MYRPFRPTVITGHTRLISGHMMAEAYQAIVAFRHRCFQGVRCRLQLSIDPLDVSLGGTVSLIQSLATVFWKEIGTSA